VKITIIGEGKTERAFFPKLREFLQPRLAGKMPKLDLLPYDGRIPTDKKLRRLVERLLNDRKHPSDAVISLTDVYTGSQPPEFETASDAIEKMRAWVGDEERFHPHAAQHDFEAWLLPYWEKVKRLAGSNRASPGPHPEQINHLHPPAHRLAEVFRTGQKGQAYVKPRDAGRILAGEDLLVSANACPQLKALLNTILELCDAELIP
jgi:hypothetical protein